jgi:hypothetical protein
MRFPVRSKLGIILSLVTILTLVSGFMVMAIASRGSGAHAASSAGVSYKTAHGQVAANPLQLGGQNPAPATSTTVYAAPDHSGTPNAAAQNAPAVASPSLLNGSAATLLHNFTGLSGLDTTILAGVRVHPPDQGLCVGHDASIAGNPEVEFELVNLAVAEYNTSGAVQTSALMPSGKESLNNFFNEPGVPFLGGELTSDPRCIYDKPTDTFFFSVLAFCAPAFGCPANVPVPVESHQDLIVYNATTHAAKEYKINSSFPTHAGCPCLGDQPKIGVDNNAIYLSVDEYQDLAAGGTLENGADVFIISKPQLVAQTTANFTAFTQLTSNGITVFSLQPAISTSSTNTEFLVNSFPFLDPAGTPNPVANTLGFWEVTGDSNVTTGNFAAVILAGEVINSESYAFPVTAVSTGSGAPRSSATLNPDDDRLQTCQFVSGDTWCSLSTAINIKGDSTTRDGVAWFKLSTTGTIAAQGYVASIGNYLIYPAIVHSASGSTGIVFTLTGGSINPSAAYVFASSGKAFGGVHIASRGTAPSTDGSVRWGDYSWATLDPNGTDLWMATEYVPPGFKDPVINYGTRIFDLA